MPPELREPTHRAVVHMLTMAAMHTIMVHVNTLMHLRRLFVICDMCEQTVHVYHKRSVFVRIAPMLCEDGSALVTSISFVEQRRH